MSTVQPNSLFKIHEEESQVTSISKITIM